MNKLGPAVILGLFFSVVPTLSGSAMADPLGGKEPWNFTPQNRAAIALAIKEIEDPGSTGPNTIVCGGNSGASGSGGSGSGSQATGNDSCIIVSNSSGAIVQTDQDSHGNQDADADVESKTSSSKPKGSIDEVGALLYGNKQGL
jgi:hypothetical protein